VAARSTAGVRVNTVLHETGHAAMALTLGVTVRVVDTIGDRDCFGYVLYEGREITDRAGLRDRAMVILAAWIEEADTLEQMPAWPVDSRQVTSTDERILRRICDYLGLDERGYDSLIGRTCEVMLEPAYRTWRTVILGMLDYTPRLDGPIIARLFPIVEAQQEKNR
jgi:hypothetical protein